MSEPKVYATFKIMLIESGYLFADGSLNGDDEVHAFETMDALIPFLRLRMAQEVEERNMLQERDKKDRAYE